MEPARGVSLMSTTPAPARVDYTRPFTPESWLALAKRYARVGNWDVCNLCLAAAHFIRVAK